MKASTRAYLADTFAALIFWTAFGLLNELVVMRLNAWQILRARVTGALIVLFYGRLFGLYYDWLGAPMKQCWNEKVVNTLLFVSFDLVAGIVMFLVAGVNSRQFLRGMLGFLVFLMLTGHIYVVWLKIMRRCFGVR